MLLSSFLAEFRKLGGVWVTPSVVLLHRPLQVYDLAADAVLASGKNKNRFDPDILNTDIDGKTLGEHIASWSAIPIMPLNGGNGSSSDGFDGEWPSGGDKGHGARHDWYDYPARFNQRVTTPEDTLARFTTKHGSDDMEHGIAVDDRGFVTRYVHGERGSVAISAYSGETIYHNHPAAGWPAFSKEDIISSSMDSSRGIVATSTKAGRNPETAKYAGTYKFTKNQNFDSAGLVKEVNRAHLRGKDYNDAVNKWLGNKARQRKYGYKYSYTPAD